MSAQPGLFALIGAGPSLDYCSTEIQHLISRRAHFFISDSVAAGFLKLWRPERASIFTVEARRHTYLNRIGHGADCFILAYQGSNPRNLRFTTDRVVSHFRLTGEAGNLPALYSPGTVFGTMLSCAVALSAENAASEIHLLGADLFYLDNQVYSRLIDSHTPHVNRLQSRELWQYEIVLKRSTELIARSGFGIRTSFEFLRARQNMRDYAQQISANIHLIEYSPLGIDSPRVEKRIPARS